MAIVIKKGRSAEPLIREVERLAGTDLNVCYQCKKCTGGCPVGRMARRGPAEVMRRLHLGAGRELLDSDIIWMCVSCETCSARCPMGIDIAAVMDALRRLARESGAAGGCRDAPLFNKAFLKSVERFGRTYDLAMVAAYKVGSRKFMADVDRFGEMLRKRKIAVLPPRGADKKTVQRIFRKAGQQGGEK